MVKGMELFREHFSDYTEYFMLIGGSACEQGAGDRGQGAGWTGYSVDRV